MNPVDVIRRKRDGYALAAGTLRSFVEGFVAGAVADYQMSAFLMAALLRGLNDAETVELTEAMLDSGRVLSLSTVRAPKVDKHSTGGVGDKVSLCLAPLVAACGVAVPMISGRGLGHTGGTLDKLEAIPGYRVNLDVREFERVVRTVGVSMIGQTAELAPADRRIYALRDVTGTVESVPLIVASILSKKLAEGIDGLVLDVKAGRGAFMKDLPSARRLAKALVSVGRRAGKRVTALLTSMSEPLGTTIGNALETREAIDVLRGEGPADTTELTFALGVEMLLLARAERSAAAARRRLGAAVASGAGLAVFRRMVEAHGGDPRVVDDPSRLPTARYRVAVRAPRAGFVVGVDALELGLTSVELGAGRTRADQAIDAAVGIELAAKRGSRVEKGEPMAWLHVASRRGTERAATRVRGAFTIAARRPAPARLVLGRLRSD